MPEAIIEHRERDSLRCIRTTSDIEDEVYRMPFTRRAVYQDSELGGKCLNASETIFWTFFSFCTSIMSRSSSWIARQTRFVFASTISVMMVPSTYGVTATFAPHPSRILNQRPASS